MDRTIRVTWSTGLIGALAITLVILKEVALVVRSLQGIQQLAQHTREAAQGVAANVAATSKLADAEEPARRLHEAAGSLASAAASIEQKLAPLGAGSSRRRG